MQKTITEQLETYINTSRRLKIKKTDFSQIEIQILSYSGISWLPIATIKIDASHTHVQRKELSMSTAIEFTYTWILKIPVISSFFLMLLGIILVISKTMVVGTVLIGITALYFILTYNLEYRFAETVKKDIVTLLTKNGQMN